GETGRRFLERRLGHETEANEDASEAESPPLRFASRSECGGGYHHARRPPNPPPASSEMSQTTAKTAATMKSQWIVKPTPKATMARSAKTINNSIRCHLL